MFKLQAGAKFPKDIYGFDQNGEKIDITKVNGQNWKMIVVYRGRHCPLCTKYLNELEQYIKRLSNAKVDVIAISADNQSQLKEQLEKLHISFPIYWGLSVEDMKKLGVYISQPRSEKETDHLFAEPGLFIINESGDLHVTDISNNPFVRPHLESLVSGIEWIKNPENNYPIRGTHQ